MGNRSLLATKEFYHIYNRGTEKRNVFLSPKDYERFLLLLYVSNSKKPIHLNNHRGSTSVELLHKTERGERLVDLAAYCLMPNHFHLLVRQNVEDGLSKFMQKVSTGYTMYFNVKNERSGALFQGKFKSEHASEDRYLKYLLSYIHLNPVKLIEPKWRNGGILNSKKMKAYLQNYPYSSYKSFCNKKNDWHKILNKESLPNYFHKIEDFEKEITEWLHYTEDTEVRPR